MKYKNFRDEKPIAQISLVQIISVLVIFTISFFAPAYLITRPSNEVPYTTNTLIAADGRVAGASTTESISISENEILVIAGVALITLSVLFLVIGLSNKKVKEYK